jgi:hypothetical protein
MVHIVALISGEQEVITMAGYRGFTNEQIQTANSVNLIKLAEQFGYTIEDKDPRAYHALHSGGLYFFKDKNTFFHHASGRTGGAISFIEMATGQSFVDAVKYLLGDPAIRSTAIAHPDSAKKQVSKNILQLPQPAATYKRAYWYLTGHRHIAPQIVSRLINEKKIYQDARGNCVFVGYGFDGKTAKYATRRGTYPETVFKRDVPGSDKSYPFCLAGSSDKVFVFESPIDAMAHASMMLSFGLDWHKHHHISLGCLSDKALERFLSWHSEISRIVFCYDNDKDGRRPMPGKPGETEPYNWGQKQVEIHYKKYAGMGYKVAIKTPAANDFAEDLAVLKNRGSEENTD